MEQLRERLKGLKDLVNEGLFTQVTFCTEIKGAVSLSILDRLISGHFRSCRRTTIA